MYQHTHIHVGVAPAQVYRFVDIAPEFRAQQAQCVVAQHNYVYVLNCDTSVQQQTDKQRAAEAYLLGSVHVRCHVAVLRLAVIFTRPLEAIKRDGMYLALGEQLKR